MTIIFYLKKAKKATPTSLIMVKIYHHQFLYGVCISSTKERIPAKDWIQPTKRVGEKLESGRPKRGYESLELRLLDIKRQVIDFIRDNPQNVTRAALKQHLKGQTPKEEKPNAIEAVDEKTMIDLWSEYLASIKDTVEWRTFNSYSNSFETTPGKKRKGINFREFVIDKGWEKISPKNFTIDHYRWYHGHLNKNVKPNTVAKRLKHFKQFLSHLVQDLKVPVGFDIERIRYKEIAGLKLSLSEDELHAYIDADLANHLIKVRDLAVIQCSTGLRISDRQRVDKNIRGDKIVIEAQKTRAKMEIPITQQVRQILEKYNYQLPQISEQHYRAGIKEIHKKLFPNQKVQVRDGNGYKDVYVWEEISSHDMVRTFINLSAERGMPIPSIAVITGKSVAVLLKNYLVASQKVADRDMAKAWGVAMAA